MPPRLAVSRRLAVKTLGFVASVVLAGVITWSLYGISDVGIKLFCCPLFITLPIIAVLTLILRSKKMSSLLTVLPLLVFPLLFILFFANTVYERTPEYMFKRYVADPIPAGVTNIQGRYISQFIFVEAVITFQASPEAVDTIIAQNDFEMTALGGDDYPDKDLPEYSWEGHWVGYERVFFKSNGGVSGYVSMWFDPEQSLVVFRYVR